MRLQQTNETTGKTTSESRTDERHQALETQHPAATPQPTTTTPSTRVRGKQSPQQERHPPASADITMEDNRPIGSRSLIPSPDPTSHSKDYWVREGHLWKRVHINPRTSFYSPEPSNTGPIIDNLLPTRQTFIKPTDGRGHRERSSS